MAHDSPPPLRPQSLGLLELADLRDCSASPRERSRRVVALWKACFDEAADGEQKELFVVAGLIGELRQWKKLYKLWDKALASGKPIARYSFKEGGRRHIPGSIFHGWTDAQVFAKRMQLRAAIKGSGLESMMSFVYLPDFWAIANSGVPMPKRWRDPYLPSFANALLAISAFMDEQEKLYLPKPRKPLVLFHRLSSRAHENRARDIYAAYADAKPHERSTYRVGRWLEHEPAGLFAREEDDVGLQAADLLASSVRWNGSQIINDLPVPRGALTFTEYARGTKPDQLEIAVWKEGLAALLKEKYAAPEEA